MDISLPYSRDKRYLTGIDWAVNVLHAITKQAVGHGNSSQIILCLDEQLDPVELRELLGRVFSRHPVLTGRVRRDWNLCPFWSMGTAQVDDPPLTVGAEVAGWEDAFGALQHHVNQPFASPENHLHFHLVPDATGGSYLGMRFDHRLLDAAGAEAFLELIDLAHTGRDAEAASKISLVEGAHLDNWSRRFIGGKGVNRLQLRLSREEVASFPPPMLSPSVPTRFELITLSNEEKDKLSRRAFTESRAPLLLPSMVASLVGSLHRLAKNRRSIGGHYVIPVSVVDRTPAQKWEKLFFNHISFIIFQVAPEVAGDRERLVTTLRDQLYEQMKNGLPDDLYHASMLTRIVPLDLLRCMARIPMRGKVGTSYFACLRESAYERSTFMGRTVANLIHTPHVPPPPGVGVFLNGYGDRMNLVLSHLEGIFAPGEARTLIADIRRQLLDETDENL